jgi:hypothetical protein
MASPSSGGGAGGGGAAPGEATRCGWCNGKDLHKLLNLPGQKNLCPLKALTEKSKAREGAKWVMDQRRANPAKDIQELLNNALLFRPNQHLSCICPLLYLAAPSRRALN